MATKRSTTDSENQHSFIFYHALILWWLFIQLLLQLRVFSLSRLLVSFHPSLYSKEFWLFILYALMALNFVHESHRKDYSSVCACLCRSLILIFYPVVSLASLTLGAIVFMPKAQSRAPNRTDESRIFFAKRTQQTYERMHKYTNPHIYHSLK